MGGKDQNSEDPSFDYGSAEETRTARASGGGFVAGSSAVSCLGSLEISFLLAEPARL
jgi:hypothetical protein